MRCVSVYCIILDFFNLSTSQFLLWSQQSHNHCSADEAIGDAQVWYVTSPPRRLPSLAHHGRDFLLATPRLRSRRLTQVSRPATTPRAHTFDRLTNSVTFASVNVTFAL
ncbi:hypothetical protein O0L34_g6084 [Tuta absoluta]|nr:hypothetical protein O0L34_g6084 [Tuta absoluta]